VGIRALREGDDRSGFRSGDPDLDRFFHRFAGQNQLRLFVGVTYVAIEEDRILGYATVAAGHLEVDALPVALRRGFPGHPLPILRLARLAVSVDEQRRGIGSELLRFVMNLALGMSTEFGCVAVVVDAKARAVGLYERYGFVKIESVLGGSDARPPPTLLFLSLATLRRATGGGRRRRSPRTATLS